MRDEHEKVLSAAATAGVIGILVGIAKGVIQQKHGGIGSFVRGLTASILVAVLIGWGLADAELSPTMLAAIVGVCAYLADDVILGLGEAGKLFGADPFGFVGRVWAAIRGRQ